MDIGQDLVYHVVAVGEGFGVGFVVQVFLSLVANEDAAAQVPLVHFLEAYLVALPYAQLESLIVAAR